MRLLFKDGTDGDTIDIDCNAICPISDGKVEERVRVII
jgi:hypothetical protein